MTYKEINELIASGGGNRALRRQMSKRNKVDLHLIQAYLYKLEHNTSFIVPEGMEEHKDWVVAQGVYGKLSDFRDAWNHKYAIGERSFELPESFPVAAAHKLGILGPNGEMPPAPPGEESKDHDPMINRKLALVYGAIVLVIAGAITWYFYR
jgi:hypothetical protein